MNALTCRVDLPGWRLYFASLRLLDEFDPHRLEILVRETGAAFRRDLTGQDLVARPVIAALRELFKQAGTSPSRYRPSSEALGRRLLKGEELPRIQPLVDVNNLLSVVTLCPCCVMRPGSVEPPLTLRRGRSGDVIQGLRGPLDLEGKPTLEDAGGPFGTPITDDHRVILRPEDRSALLVAYLPADGAPDVAASLRGLAEKIPGLQIGSEWHFA
jgi:DNA/RNA-binding domain of Phe-tRNA-synthetase-like protein